MIFTLEALQAGKGDSLILHYGPADNPKFMVIDGGPKDVFRLSLGPRLEKLRERWFPDGELPIEMLIVSHVDDDHIRGVLDWVGKLLDLRENGESPPWRIKTIWYNSFDDVLGNTADELKAALASIGAGLAAGIRKAGDALAPLAASIDQGRDLRQAAEKLAIRLNAGIRGPIVARAGAAPVDWGDGLRLNILGPTQKRVENLIKEWDKFLQRKGLGMKKSEAAAAGADQSVFNLSSVVLLAEMEGKRMLLTGDARGDEILEGLETAGLLGGSSIHVDILKLPHHGGDRNVSPEFFRRVIADHYLASGNGENDNPEPATLKMITEARGTDAYTFHFTNREGVNDLGRKLRDFFAEEEARGRRHSVVFREDTVLSLSIDLLEPVRY